MKIFDNPELQEIYEKSGKFIEDNREKLDKVSRDIKQMEMFLKQHVFVPYHMNVTEGGIYFILSFDNGRIFHHHSQEIKPLLETKVSCRLRAAPHLKKFLEKAIESSQI